MSKSCYAMWNSIRKMLIKKGDLLFLFLIFLSFFLSLFFSFSQCAIMSCCTLGVSGAISKKLQGKRVYCEPRDCQESASNVPVRAVKC